MYLGGFYGGALTRPLLSITIAPVTLPDPVSETLYQQSLTASGGDGGPYRFAVAAGTLPPGLTLSTDGVIAGIPTTALALLPATWPVGVVDAPYQVTLTLQETGVDVASVFTVRAVDAMANAAEQPYTLTMQSGWGLAYYQLAPGTVLPTCLRLSTTGVVSGIFCRVGTWPVTVQVINGAGTTETWTMMVTAAPAPVLA
jgi:hypothetical protein